MSILVVDPDPLAREKVCSILEGAGYQPVRQAGSAEEAMKALEQPGEEAEDLPACVLLASQLPDLSGLECLKLIHSKPLWRELAVVMMLDPSDTASVEKALDSGAYDFVARPVEPTLLLVRLRAALSLKAETQHRLEQERELLDATARLQEVITRLQGLSGMDALTGLANKRHFDDTLAKEWRRLMREQQPLALLMIELDDFAILTNRHGRPKAEEALRSVATTLQVSFSRPADLAARLGGEGFAMLLPGVSAGGVAFLAEKVRHGIAKLEVPNLDAPRKILTASVGASCILPKGDLRLGFLVAAAEEALFEAKRKGGDQIEVNALGE